MLKDICKKDKYWRTTATFICKNKTIADDLVQDMYLKVSTITKPINDYYIILIIRNLWIDMCRKKGTTVDIDSLYYVEDKQKIFEPDDYEAGILEKANNLEKYVQKEYLEDSYDRTIREIGRENNANYGFVYRELNKARREVLGSDYAEKYNNKRLKYRKPKK
jgi:DNA-directed RNA polymerase specialized sigma24 family protein